MSQAELHPVAPAAYVTLPLAERITGYSVKAIERKIERGQWREGHEWVKAPDGHRLISLRGYERWAEQGRG